MSFRLMTPNSSSLLFASAFYKVGGGVVDPLLYKITKGNVDIPIESIDVNNNSFKVSMNPATSLPYVSFLEGELVDISFGKYPIACNIAKVGYDNDYVLSIPFESGFFDQQANTSKLRREYDFLEIFDLPNGLYHTDTGYLIIVGDNYKTIVDCPYSNIYDKRPDLRDDANKRGGLEHWQLANKRRLAYTQVMKDIQGFRNEIGENFMNLDPEPIIELIAIKTVSSYEESHEKDRLLFTFKYQRELRAYRPEYKTFTPGGNLEESKGIKVRF